MVLHAGAGKEEELDPEDFPDAGTGFRGKYFREGKCGSDAGGDREPGG